MQKPPSYRRLYPSKEALVFDGGLDTKFEKALIPVNESPDCLNVEFVNGAVQTRQGGTRLNTSAAGNVPFDGLYTRRSSDGTTENLLAFIGGSMKQLATTTFITVPSAQSVFSIGARVGAEIAENYIFIGNGSAGPYKYDGTDFTTHGISAPVTTMSVASSTTGSLTTSGAYLYKVTFVNSALVESDVSPATSTFVVSTAGLSTTLTSVPVGSATSQGVAFRRIYRTIASGTAYFRVAQINDNTTTTYHDVIADASLGSPAPTDIGVPPKYNAIIYLNNILFVNDAANPNYVWYSVAGNPYSFPSTNFFKVGDRAGDLVKGFAVYDNNLVIFCENSIWMNLAEDYADSTTWRRIKTNSPYGCKSAYSLLNCSVRGTNIILFPAVLNRKFVGFAGLNGDAIAPTVTFQTVTTVASDLESQVIEPDMFNVQEAFEKNISGIVYKNRAFVTLTYGANQTTNNRIYVWDFSTSNITKDQTASWVPWTSTVFNIQQFALYNGHVYGASSDSTGFVYRLIDTGVYADNGSAINSYWNSKEYCGYEEDMSYTKDFRYMNLLYDNAGPYFMNFLYRVDSDLGTGQAIQIDLTSGASLWGTMVWGVDDWGGGVAQTEAKFYFGDAIRGKRLQIQFNNQNVAGQRFTVHRGQFLYNIKGYR